MATTGHRRNGHTPSRTLRPTTSPTTTPASAPEDPAEAEERVRDAWARFFSPKTSIEDKAEVAESGDEYQLMIEAFAKDPKTRVLRVRVDSVTFTSDLQARFGYTLFTGDRNVGPDGPGASVRQDDTWKVSAKTVCSLTKYGKDVPQPRSADGRLWCRPGRVTPSGNDRQRAVHCGDLVHHDLRARQQKVRRRLDPRE